MNLQKKKRVKDKELLDKVRMMPCVACGRHATREFPNDPHHVTTRGAGGGDTDENVMPLCHKHHVEWHAIGPGRMIDQYFGLERWLIRYNRFDILENGGKLK